MVTNFNSYNLILIMNKILKCLLVGILSCLLLPCFTNATITSPDFTLSKNYVGLDSFVALNDSYYGLKLTFNGGNAIYCVKEQYYELSNGFLPSIMLCDGSESVDLTSSLTTNYNNNTTHCKKLGELTYMGNNPNSITVDYSCYNNYPVAYAFANNTVSYNRYIGVQQFFYNSNLTTKDCTVMSSLECQTEYNLIPINDVTENYCKLNFNLISPSECPESGTGAVNWNAWYINNEQYPGTASLQIWIPEFIKYTVTYDTEESEIDIEGYNADEEYIEGVIDKEKLTPTNEDFTLLLQGVVNFIPYLFIGLLIFFTVKIINRIWR